MDQVHKWLVDALGDDQSVAALGTEAWLEGPAWALAVERSRLARYSSLPKVDGARRVGLELGRAFLRTEVGLLLRETLPLLTAERAMETLAPALSRRLRRDFELTYAEQVLRIRGTRSTPATTTLGFFEAMLELVPKAPSLELGEVTDSLLELRLVSH